MDEKKDLRHLCGAKVHQEGIDHFSIPDLVDELESFISQFSTHDMIAQAYMQGQIDQGIDPSWSGATAYAKSVATTPQPPAVPDGWREQIERAVGLAAVFDDGGDGADSESARSVVNILNELLDTPPPRPGAITWTTYALRVGRKEE